MISIEEVTEDASATSPRPERGEHADHPLMSASNAQPAADASAAEQNVQVAQQSSTEAEDLEVGSLFLAFSARLHGSSTTMVQMISYHSAGYNR